MSQSETSTNRLEIIHPKSTHHANESQLINADYELIGHIHDAKMYASECLINELKVIRGLGWRATHNIYHATSSVALEAIARHDALLSSKQLLEKDEPITTGEITTDMGEFHRDFGGLPDVYASDSPIDIRYAQLADENEYPVIFGIDRESVRDRLNHSLNIGNGMRLGPHVPIEYINTHIVPFEKIPAVQAWAVMNDRTEALTMSWDAACVLNYQNY